MAPRVMAQQVTQVALKLRYLGAMAALAAIALCVVAVLLYAHASGGIGDRGLTLGLIATGIVGSLGALGLVAALADSFARPLRAVVAALNGAARGDYSTPPEVGD